MFDINKTIRNYADNRDNEDVEENCKKEQLNNMEILYRYFNTIKQYIKNGQIKTSFINSIDKIPFSKILKIKYNHSNYEFLMAVPYYVTSIYMYIKINKISDNDIINFENDFMNSILFYDIQDFNSSSLYF